MTGQTPSQTVGPFFAFGLTATQYGYPGDQFADGDLADASVPGARITITGRVLDGEGQPIPDALVEIWQADGAGRFAGEGGGNTGFRGFGQCAPRNRLSVSSCAPAAKYCCQSLRRAVIH